MRRNRQRRGKNAAREGQGKLQECHAHSREFYVGTRTQSLDVVRRSNAASDWGRSSHLPRICRHVAGGRQLPLGAMASRRFVARDVFSGGELVRDSLDGTVARVRGRQRPRYGFYVDHMIHSFGGLFLIGGLAASGYIRWQIAHGMLIGFFLLSIESYLAAYTLEASAFPSGNLDPPKSGFSWHSGISCCGSIGKPPSPEFPGACLILAESSRRRHGHHGRRCRSVAHSAVI